jgi:DNA-binding transcriptional regulator YiaG
MLIPQTLIMSRPNTHIGDELRRVRQSLDMTLEQFGDLVGIPWQTIHHYETGRAVPAGDRLLIIMHAARKAKKPFRVEMVARAVAAAA